MNLDCMITFYYKLPMGQIDSQKEPSILGANVSVSNDMYGILNFSQRLNLIVLCPESENDRLVYRIYSDNRVSVGVESDGIFTDILINNLICYRLYPNKKDVPEDIASSLKEVVFNRMLTAQ